MNRNVLIGVVAVVVAAAVGAAVFFKGSQETKEPFPVSAPESKPPKTSPDLRPGPNWKWTDAKWKQWCAEHSRDVAAAKGCEGNAVFRRAAEQGVIGMSDEERNKKLDDAWK